MPKPLDPNVPPPYATRAQFDHGAMICDLQDQVRDAAHAGRVVRMKARHAASIQNPDALGDIVDDVELPPVLSDEQKLAYYQRALEIVRCYSSDALSRVCADIVLQEWT